MRRTNIATALALALASSVYAVPARNHGIRVVHREFDGSSGALKQGFQGRGGNAGGEVQQNDAETAQGGGLVALPGGQVTTGGLQPLPGATTASVAESTAVAIETSSAVEISAGTETSAAVETSAVLETSFALETSAVAETSIATETSAEVGEVISEVSSSFMKMRGP